eukprot:TRINITY_DN10205_c2_g1_i2.p1 TRINITY_DN10205_c2_g1~~TRINITY_DN10205_c2_g1_i2.p1  ORF type:complete len:1257 (+),score=225.48 TRINITY_DN10205_c2_g1_i2:57-3827(+)
MASWPAGVEARKFLLENKVMEVIESGLGKLLEEKPEDSCGWLAKYAKGYNQTEGRTVKTSEGNVQVWECPDDMAGIAPRFRRAGDSYIWGLAAVGMNRWKALIAHTLSTHTGFKSIVVINTSTEPLIIVKGAAYYSDTHNKSRLSDGSFEKAIIESTPLPVTYYNLPLPTTATCPLLWSFDEIAAVAERHLPEAESTAVFILSASGKDDVTTGMTLYSTALSQMSNVKRLAVRRREWKETVRDREICKHKTASIIHRLYQQGQEKDEALILQQEADAEANPTPETDVELQDRMERAARLRSDREAQWARYQAYVKSAAITKIAAAYRGHADRKKVKSQKLARAKTQKKVIKQQLAAGVQPQEKTGPKTIGWHGATNPFADLKELSIYRSTVDYILSAAPGELFTLQDRPKVRKVTKKPVMVPAEDTESWDLFSVVTVEEAEEGTLEDYSVPVTLFITTLQSCACRDILLGIYECRTRYKSVPAVQARVMRTLEWLVVGMCFSSWAAMREAAASAEISEAFCVDQSQLSPSQQTFTSWFENTPLYTKLCNHHLSSLLSTATLQTPILKDRVLCKSPICRGVFRAPSVRSSRTKQSSTGRLLPTKRSMRTLQHTGTERERSGEDSQRAFKKVHRKLPLFSVPDPLSPEDTSDVVAHMLPSVKTILWFSLTPSLTVQVGPHTLSAPLTTPSMCPSLTGMETLNTCKVTDTKPTSPTISAGGKEKKRARCKTRGPGHMDPEIIDSPCEEPFTSLEEVPVLGHLWSAQEKRLVTELKQGIAKTGEITFNEGKKDGLIAFSNKKVPPKKLTPVTQTVLRLEKEKDREIEKGTSDISRISDKKDERKAPMTPKRGASTISTTIGSPEKRSSPSITSVTLGYVGMARQSSECGASIAGSIPESAILEESEKLPTNVDDVVMLCAENISNIVKKENFALRFTRQPLLEGPTRDTYDIIDRIVHEIEAGFTTLKEHELAIVIGHSDDMNPFLLTLVTIVFGMLSKKHHGEDAIDILVRARKQSEINNKRASIAAMERHTPSEEELQQGTPQSVVSSGESTTLPSMSGEESESLSDTTDSDVTVEGFTLTHQLMQKPNNETFCGSEPPRTPDHIPVSPFPCIDQLAKSPLGTSLSLEESIEYIDTLFQHTNKGLEEGVIGRIPLTIQEISSSPVSDLLHLSRKLACWLESYSLLLFFTSWMKGYITNNPDLPYPSFSSWMFSVHPETHQWLCHFDPWGNQGAPRGVDPLWTSARYRWTKQTLPSEVI